jgi:hypothetical protein
MGETYPALPVQNDLNQKDALLSLLFNFTLEYALGRSKKAKTNWN